MFWDYRFERKWSAIGFCSGAIAGLITITPASGFVGSPAAIAFGFVGATACNFATQLKFVLGYDDALDIFASHGVGGLVGNILTGIFAQRAIANLDEVTVIKGGWLDRHWMQVVYQLADSAAGLGYSFFMTTLILWVMHYIPGLSLRVSEEVEGRGIDDAEMGEFAYDYVGLEELGQSIRPGGGLGAQRIVKQHEHCKSDSDEATSPGLSSIDAGKSSIIRTTHSITFLEPLDPAEKR